MLMSVVQGYSTSAQTQNALDGLRWVADYFVKCHHSDVAYTGQVRAFSHCPTLNLHLFVSLEDHYQDPWPKKNWHSRDPT